MAWIIKTCLRCRKTYGKEWSTAWKRDTKSHGICPKCAKKEGL